MRVLSFGEILFDMIGEDQRLGGAPLNFAAHLAMQGESSCIYSRVGKDALGDKALQQMQTMGIKTNFVQVDAQHPTGRVTVSLAAGQPEYTIQEQVAYDYIAYEEAGKPLAGQKFDLLYFGTLAQRGPQSRQTLRELVRANKFRHIFYDVNLRKNCCKLDIIEHSLLLCTILKLNDKEVKALSQLFYGLDLSEEAFMQKLAVDYGINLIIVTAGERGCFVYDHGQVHFVPGYPVQVIDTVGAGQAFSAAFIRSYCMSKNALLAADLANRLGAFVAASRGPLPAYSTEIKALLELTPGMEKSL